MMKPSPARPKLQTRAISDLGSLYSPEPSSGVSNDLGQGTRLHGPAGRGRLTSGARLASNGAIAPQSPFLPMPPAPSPQELAEQRRQDGCRTPTPRSPTVTQQDLNSTKKTNSRVTRPKGPLAIAKAAGMIRSYSLPVATQKEYDEQHKAFWNSEGKGSQRHAAIRSMGWPASSTFTPERLAEKHEENGFFVTEDVTKVSSRLAFGPLSVNGHGSAMVPAHTVGPIGCRSYSPQSVGMADQSTNSAASYFDSQSDSSMATSDDSADFSSSFESDDVEGPETPRANTPISMGQSTSSMAAPTLMTSGLSIQGIPTSGSYEFPPSPSEPCADLSPIDSDGSSSDLLHEGFIHPAHMAPPPWIF